MIYFDEHENLFEFCLKHGINIRPEKTTVFISCGFYRTNERYDKHCGSRYKATRKAVEDLVIQMNQVIDPKKGVYTARSVMQ